MKIERQVFFSGRVQGVGFRYTIKQIASGYKVVGWVRNLVDGRVELQVKGEVSEVEEFLAVVGGSHLRHHISERQDGGATVHLDGVSGFEIRHE